MDTRGGTVRAAGWPLVGWAALLLITMAATTLCVRGVGETGWRAVIRATAQTSLLLFTSAFVASALARTWPTPLTHWMLRNRRYLGVSFAVSHLLHLFAILALVDVAAGTFHVDAVTLVGGGIGYAFVAAMALTSFDRTARWMGPRRWKLLHTVGGHYLWLIFLLQYVALTAKSLVYAPFAMLVVAAMGLRVLAWLNGRRHVVAAVGQ